MNYVGFLWPLDLMFETGALNLKTELTASHRSLAVTYSFLCFFFNLQIGETFKAASLRSCSSSCVPSPPLTILSTSWKHGTTARRKIFTESFFFFLK